MSARRDVVAEASDRSRAAEIGASGCGCELRPGGGGASSFKTADCVKMRPDTPGRPSKKRPKTGGCSGEPAQGACTGSALGPAGGVQQSRPAQWQIATRWDEPTQPTKRTRRSINVCTLQGQHSVNARDQLVRMCKFTATCTPSATLYAVLGHVAAQFTILLSGTPTTIPNTLNGASSQIRRIHNLSATRVDCTASALLASSWST